MEIFTILFASLNLLLLIGTSKKFKLYAGGAVAGTSLLFILGEIIIKVQTGYYSLGKQEWRNQGHAETMGSWVMPFFSGRDGYFSYPGEHPYDSAVPQ
ncbi:hypothetical protein QTG56_21315 [Rossellomorea sp. AcN35-11]|nr:hypothetical protein QTG56_21315 [Rossellomorea sp. AcN35-11]